MGDKAAQNPSSSFCGSRAVWALGAGGVRTVWNRSTRGSPLVCNPRSGPGMGSNWALNLLHAKRRRALELRAHPEPSCSQTFLESSPDPGGQMPDIATWPGPWKSLCDGVMSPAKTHLLSPFAQVVFSPWGNGLTQRPRSRGGGHPSPSDVLGDAQPMRGLCILLVMALKTHQVSLCRQQDEGRWQRLSLAQLPPWGRRHRGGPR